MFYVEIGRIFLPPQESTVSVRQKNNSKKLSQENLNYCATLLIFPSGVEKVWR
jgi:hypothetical protein